MGNRQTSVHSYNTRTPIYLSQCTKYTVSIIKMSSIKMLCPNSHSGCTACSIFSEWIRELWFHPNVGKPLRLIRNINAVISAYFCTTRWSSAGFNNYYSDSLERKANQLNERIHIFSTDNCLKTTIFTWQREAHSESFKGWQVKKRSLKQKHLITIISSLLVVRSTLLVLLVKWHSPPRLPQESFILFARH